MKCFFTIGICFALTGCMTKKEEQNEILTNTETVIEKPVVKEKVLLENFSFKDVAKYVMSTVMGQNPNIMSVDIKDDLYIVSYVRKSDKQKFTYKFKFDSDIVTWANIDGRWRDTPLDETIRFEERGNTLKIFTTYSDGSTGIEEFKK